MARQGVVALLWYVRIQLQVYQSGMLRACRPAQLFQSYHLSLPLVTVATDKQTGRSSSRRSFADSLPGSVWFADGLCFSCTNCGACCTGSRQQQIQLSSREQQQVAKYLGVTDQDFQDRYLVAGYDSTRQGCSGVSDCICYQMTSIPS